MKSNRCPKRATRSASPSSSSASLNYRSSARTSASSSGSALSPVHSASLALFALLLLCAAPLCPGTPVFLNPSTVQHEQLLNLIDNACSSYLSAEQPLRTSDVLRDFCGLMLGVLRKSQELAAREPSKREEMQGPGAIQSRGYFLYRPRNGRRSTEYV
ncbi:neuromedin-U isoform X5 [Pygocentrus nattereri]|uniref:Neuromedin U C-terminal domain-containing protein n=1 Tax=Pygocentrus nattereri TaxID=42514 RepID=A0A3B4BX18_PYGNA|nr:neuromedin-U isoform X5 [Pygocentrus nattereri]